MGQHKKGIVKGFLIRSEEKDIQTVYHDTKDYRQIYKLLDIDNSFTVVQIDDVNCIYVDDEGLLNKPRYFFDIKGYPQPLAGRGLVLGCDQDTGDTIGTNLTIEELREMISFSEHSVKGFVTEEGTTEFMGNEKTPMIKTTPVFGPFEEDETETT
jgi:hypothetical protein